MNKPSAKNDDDEYLKSLIAENEKWSELIYRQDAVGRRYLMAEQFRRSPKLHKEGLDFLREFDAERKRFLRDPESVARKGIAMIHQGLMLIETLIHEKRAQNVSVDKDRALRLAVSMLSSVATRVRNDYIRYAEDGLPWACVAIFTEAKLLAGAFSRLAIAWPEHFRQCAEESLTMPSLRARNPNFTCDAEAIISSIHLAEKHPAGNIHDNRSRIGALCHLFMAEIVDVLEYHRQWARQENRAESKWFNLPELKGNAKAWWKADLKKLVHREFDWMKKYPRHNPALWRELEKITDHGTLSARRVAFEKYCFNKLEQIAGRPVLPASAG
jgi:hypothetical protein